MKKKAPSVYAAFRTYFPVYLLTCGATLAFLAGCGGGGNDSQSDATMARAPAIQGATTTSHKTGIPGRDAWERNMVVFGQLHCNLPQIAEQSTWEGSVWYYDGIRVYYQIADYTGDSSFNRCAAAVRDVYGDYVVQNAGQIPAWRVFPVGLAMNFDRTQNEDSKQGVLDLAFNSPFAGSGGGESFELSRETAYLIRAYLEASRLGGGSFAELPTSVQYAQSHIKQWLSSAPYVKPFMVALTAEALIAYAEATGDTSVTQDLPAMAAWLRAHAWDQGTQSFRYIVCRDSGASEECAPDIAIPAPDLNLLIVPLYGYVAMQQHDRGTAAFGDVVFHSGVSNAYLSGGKQFSQNYRWSFDYVRWRDSMGQ